MNIEGLKQNMVSLKKLLTYMPESKDSVTTLPDIFCRTYDENFISDYLAYILNPSLNGVGLQPLVKLIEKHSKDSAFVLKNITGVEAADLSVIREYPLDDGRRIDIFINYNNELVIGIENKIFAA